MWACGDTIKARALETPRLEQSEPAIMKPTALSIDPEKLMEQIVDPANVDLAWKNVRANRGAPGPDGVTIAAFPKEFRSQWPKVRQQLLDGTYNHASPYPDLRSWFFRIEFRFSTQTLCSWSSQASATAYRSWLPPLCRYGGQPTEESNVQHRWS